MLIKESRMQKFPRWVLESGLLKDKKDLYDSVVESIVSLSDEGKSREEVYLSILDQFKDNEFFNPDKFNLSSIDLIKRKNKDRITVNLNKKRNLRLPGWVLRSGSPQGRKDLYDSVVEVIVSLSNEGKSYEEVHISVLEQFKDNELFNSDKFNLFSINAIKKQNKDRITVNLSKKGRKRK